MIPYLPVETIRQYVTELLGVYETRRGKPISFPIDAHDIATRVFGLEVIYDSKGILNQIGDGILGCTYPDGHRSPWGRDKIIAINLTSRGSFDPTSRSENHTIAHECAGHYMLHFLKGVMGEQYRGPRSCTSRKDPLEWQADFAGGELLMPYNEVQRILDGNTPPDVINLDVYGHTFKQHFGANPMQMETRLHVLGYRLLNGRYEWANHSAPVSGAARSLNTSIGAGRHPRGYRGAQRRAPQVDTKMLADAMKLFGAINQVNPFDWSALHDLFTPVGFSSGATERTPPKRRQN